MDWLSQGCSIMVDGEEVATLQGLECIFRAIFNVAIRLAGLALLAMLIVGGFKFLTAGGDKEKLSSAQKTITSALIGLALMIVAWFILLFIREFTGVDVTIFTVPSYNL